MGSPRRVRVWFYLPQEPLPDSWRIKFGLGCPRDCATVGKLLRELDWRGRPGIDERENLLARLCDCCGRCAGGELKGARRPFDCQSLNAWSAALEDARPPREVAH